MTDKTYIAANTSSTTDYVDPLNFVEILHNMHNEWNEKYYKSTTAKLLEILANCSEALAMLRTNQKLRKEFFNRFDALPASLKGKGLSITSKLVRYVFRFAGNRSSAYAKVIEVAVAAGIKPADLPGWVERQGGIEAVRRGHKPGQKPAELFAQAVANASDALADAQPLCVIADLPQQLHASANNAHNFSLALVRHDPTTGRGEVLYGIQHAGLINQFLAHIEKPVVARSKNKAAAAATQNDLATRDTLINEALAPADSRSELAVA